MDLYGFVSHDGPMFAPYCTREKSRMLLGYESVVGIEQTVFGPKVLLRCYCGDVLVQDIGTSGRGDAGAAGHNRAATQV
jgi:hypothetical protein